jgi:hypothetical protein
MPYSYHVEFDMDPGRMNLLEVGGELETIAATLKALLPGEEGLVSSRTLYSLDRPEAVRVVFESEWEDWDDLVRHREGELDEYKYVTAWAPPAVTGPVNQRTYGETGI